MATHEFDLVDGLAIGEGDARVVHKHVTLRTLTAGDLEDAALDAERVIRGDDDNLVIASSPVLMSNAILRRQILRIGTITGPLPKELLRLLSSIDLELLQAEADRLDAAGRKLVEAALMRGRPDGPATGVQPAGGSAQ